MTHHNDSQLIADANHLVKAEGHLQWAWGDWALEAEPLGADGVHTGAISRIMDLLSKVEDAPTFDTVMLRRRIAARFEPRRRRLGWSFSVHQALASWSDEKLADLPDKLTREQARALVAVERNHQESLLTPTGSDEGDLDSLPELPASERRPLAAPPSYGRRVWGVTQAFLDAIEPFEAVESRLLDEGIDMDALIAEGFDIDELYQRAENLVRIAKLFQRAFKAAAAAAVNR